MKVCSNGPGHMTYMAAMPIYGKIIKKLLKKTQKFKFGPLCFYMGKR